MEHEAEREELLDSIRNQNKELQLWEQVRPCRHIISPNIYKVLLWDVVGLNSRGCCNSNGGQTLLKTKKQATSHEAAMRVPQQVKTTSLHEPYRLGKQKQDTPCRELAVWGVKILLPCFGFRYRSTVYSTFPFPPPAAEHAPPSF